MPTPEELDKLSNALLGELTCEHCKQKCRNFSALVTHLKARHPNEGDPRPRG